MRLKEDKLTRTLKIMGIVTLGLASLFILSQFTAVLGSIKASIQSVLVPFLIAFFINFLLQPVVIYLEEKGIRPRWLIVSMMFVVIMGILVTIILLITPVVVEQLTELISKRLPALFNTIVLTLEEMNFDSKLVDQVISSLEANLESQLLNFATSLTQSIPKLFDVFLTIILIPIILFFMLKDYSQIGEGLFTAVPLRFRDHFAVIAKRINGTIGMYLRGQFILMIFIGSVATLFYLLIGLDYAIVFGVIVGLTNIIPYIGATLAAVPPIAYALLAPNAPPWYTVLGLNLFFQIIEGNILQPVIMSKQLDLHPLLIIAAILGFGSLLGVVGVIFATPIAGIIKVLISYYKEVKAENEKLQLEGNNI